MKKNIILLLLILFVLTGCAKPFYYDLETLKKDVISAEIVEVRVTKESDEFILVNKVDDIKLNELLNDISNIKFQYGGAPDIPSGLALKLNYNDGYEVISNTYIFTYPNDDKTIWKKSVLIYSDLQEILLKYKTENSLN